MYIIFKITRQPVEPPVAVSAVAVRAPFCLLAQDRLKAHADIGWNVQPHNPVLGHVDINTTPHIEVVSTSFC